MTSYEIGANQNDLTMVVFLKQNLVSQVDSWGPSIFHRLRGSILSQVKQGPIL